MRIISGSGNRKPWVTASTAVTIGVFDGVHRGHRMVLARTVAWARRHGLLSVVVTFDAHPTHGLGHASPVAHLTGLRHKLSLLAGSGIDIVYVLAFDKAFARRDPDRFVEDFLVGALKMRALFVGRDFVFGRDASGDVALLRRAARVHGFHVATVAPVKEDGRVISSTWVRRLIQEGALERAARLQGRPVSIWGRVVPGVGRGRTLGFPTANLDVAHECLAPDGIYATRAVLGRRLYPCVTYIGRRPTFGLGARAVEVYFPGLRKDLYGRFLEVQFINRLRKDRAFASREALARQMSRDVQRAERILKGLN
jgi:riboflavin kinase/FMN adenylyltransferase